MIFTYIKFILYFKTTPFWFFQFYAFWFKKRGCNFSTFNGFFFGDLNFVFVYLDDILISSENEKEHSRHLREVFKRLSKAGLAIDVDKSEFFTSELEFLGHVVSASSIRQQPS